MKQTEKYLALATPENRERYEGWKRGLPEDWAGGQAAFLRMTEEYLRKEETKPVEANIGAHEAGGQFRIAIPYLTVRDDAMVEARKAYTDKTSTMAMWIATRYIMRLRPISIFRIRWCIIICRGRKQRGRILSM